MANALSDVGYQRALAQQQSNRGERIVSNIDADFSGINEQMASMEALNPISVSCVEAFSMVLIMLSVLSTAFAELAADVFIEAKERVPSQLLLTKQRTGASRKLWYAPIPI